MGKVTEGLNMLVWKIYWGLTMVGKIRCIKVDIGNNYLKYNVSVIVTDS